MSYTNLWSVEHYNQFNGSILIQACKSPVMLPSPTLSFTLPSVHDGLDIQCRIYHPTCLTPTAASQVATWRKRAAIVAHPYAPLGGCYDDPVVHAIASTILKEGFIVGTFNFRGAAGALGRTSWQSKPEQKDYISFIGFLIYYLHQLQPPMLPISPQSSEYIDSEPGLHNLSPIPSQTIPPPKTKSSEESANSQPLLLLSGYSYGALITTSLPPIISSIIAPFQEPAAGSWHGEIRMRAAFLADQQNSLMKERLSTLMSVSSHDEDHVLTSPNARAAGSAGAIRMGGHEDLRQASHEGHRSRRSTSLEAHVKSRLRSSMEERVRSMARSKSSGSGTTSSHYFGMRRRSSSDAASVTSPPMQGKKGSERSSSEVPRPAKDRGASLAAASSMPNVAERLSVAYLVVSPLHGWINSLATMSLFGSRAGKPKRVEDDAGNNVGGLPEQDTKFTIDPTLALFGDDDVFVSVNKLRAWADRLHSACERRGQPVFRSREVPGAGHFWHDHEAAQILREEVKLFVSCL